MAGLIIFVCTDTHPSPDAIGSNRRRMGVSNQILSKVPKSYPSLKYPNPLLRYAFAMHIEPLVAHSRLARAEYALEHAGNVVYKLGRGGFDPKLKLPGNPLDCSGFIAWDFMVGRDRKNTWWTRLPIFRASHWFETSNVYRDAISGRKDSVFVRLPGLEVGAALVYPDKGSHSGHIALISEIKNGLPVIYDCSLGSYRRTGNALGHRSGAFMLELEAIPVTFRQDLVV